VKQQRNCWADGVPMVTQCPILPGHNFTYRFDVAGQEGTLWWHAHVFSLRGTVHGAFIIRPRRRADADDSYYPFPKPHAEVPIVIGEWWETDLEQMDRDFAHGHLDDQPSAATINGKLGDLFRACEGAGVEDGYVLDVEPGKTYLLRVVNAALFSEYYLRIAGHVFTVVAGDANYVRPYRTDVLAVSPGETVDALVVASAHHARPASSYYMVAKPILTPPPDPQIPAFATRATVRYTTTYSSGGNHSSGAPRSSRRRRPRSSSESDDDAPVAPEMPDDYDMMTSFYFRGNLTSLRRRRGPLVPAQADERMFVALALGSVCRRRGQRWCERGDSDETITVATMNNVSFELPPAAATTPMLDAYYRNRSGNGVDDDDDDVAVVVRLPDVPPRAFNFTDRALQPTGPEEEELEPTSRATAVRRFRHGAVVDLVFQSTALWQGDSNPMHLHGHDMFVLAQGLGNYDAARDVARYNLVDPPVRNTVLVPSLGWAAVRFVADNPGTFRGMGEMYISHVLDACRCMDLTICVCVQGCGSCTATMISICPWAWLQCSLWRMGRRLTLLCLHRRR
jgi:laccase